MVCIVFILTSTYIHTEYENFQKSHFKFFNQEMFSKNINDRSLVVEFQSLQAGLFCFDFRS
jgi:hypothetical protein